jgi:hypothetical protein
MLSDQRPRLQVRKHFAKRAAVARTKERDYASGAAAAYDAQEEDLLTIPGRSSRQARGRYGMLKQF